jgi:hypothetical protein
MSAYFLSKLVAELPKLVSKLFFCTLVYWIVGFNPSPWRFLNFVCIVLAEVLAAQAIGMVMATGMPIGGKTLGCQHWNGIDVYPNDQINWRHTRHTACTVLVLTCIAETSFTHIRSHAGRSPANLACSILEFGVLIH